LNKERFLGWSKKNKKAKRGNTIGEIICAMELGGDGLMLVDEMRRD